MRIIHTIGAVCTGISLEIAICATYTALLLAFAASLIFFSWSGAIIIVTLKLCASGVFLCLHATLIMGEDTAQVNAERERFEAETEHLEAGGA